MFSAFVIKLWCVCGDSKNEGRQSLPETQVYTRVRPRSCLRSVCKFASLVSVRGRVLFVLALSD